MIKYIIVFFLNLTPQLKASNSLSNQLERKLLCNAVSRYYDDQVTVYVDINNCLTNLKIYSIKSKDINSIEGDVGFMTYEGIKFNLRCQLDYIKSPELKNIIGGIYRGIYCN